MNVAAAKSETGAEHTANGRLPVFRLAAGVFLLVALLSMVAPHLAAQGCAMCYQNAASSGAQGRTALRHGILILLLPALSLFLGILFLIYRRRAVTRFLDDPTRPDLDRSICHSAVYPTKIHR
jgi:hypothetical protein